MVAVSAEDDSCIIGSCKFRNTLIDESELLLMQDYAQAMGNFSRHYYYLFSKSGFTESLPKMNVDDMRLLTIDTLYSSEVSAADNNL